MAKLWYVDENDTIQWLALDASTREPVAVKEKKVPVLITYIVKYKSDPVFQIIL